MVAVAKTMEAGGVGAVIVCAGGRRPLGAVTDRDLAVEVNAAEREPAETAVADLRGAVGVVTVDVDQSVDEAVKVMKERAVRRLVVVEDDQMVGVVSQADIARTDGRLAAELVEEVSSARDNTARG